MDGVVISIASIVIGFFVGILSGLLGIGGGTVMVPTFRLLFGMSAISSTATSLFAIVPTSISGAVSHVRQKTCIPALGLACGIGGALTSPLGVWLADNSPGWAIMLATGLVVAWSATSMLRKAAKMKPAPAAKAAEPAPAAEAVEPAPTAEAAEPAPAAAPEDVRLTKRQLLTGVGIGMLAGVMSGYVGVGGGFLMVPLMLSLIHINMNKASGTSLIAVMILAVPGVIEQMVLGNVNYVAGISIVVGTIPGAVVGARLVRIVPERTLRFIFGVFLLFVAVILVVTELGLL